MTRATPYLLGLFCIALVAAQSLGLSVDEFSDTVASTTTSTFTDGSMLGGERDASMSGATFDVTAGIATYTANGGIATVQFVYDGDDNSNGFNYGLGGVDLTDGGLSGAFLIRVTAITGSVNLTLGVYEDGSNRSVFTLPNVTAPGLYALPFAAFPVSAGSGADFTSAEQFGIFFNEFAGTDSISLDYIRTGVVPEPASLTLLALGALALGALALRRRRAG